MTRERALVYELNEYCLLHAESMDVETVKAFQHVSAYLYAKYQEAEQLMGGEFIRHECACLCREAD